jgi:hypothetical protein
MSQAILPSFSQTPSPSSFLAPTSVLAPDAGADAVMSISPIEASSAADPSVVPPAIVGVDPADETTPEKPTISDVPMNDTDQSFWDWFNSRLDKLKGWFDEITKSDKQGKEDGEGTGHPGK